MGSGIRKINKNNCNIFHLCCWDDNFRCLEEILNFIKAKNLNKDLEELINEKSNGGWTPLHIAAAKNSPRCFQLIMSLSHSLPLPLNSQGPSSPLLLLFYLFILEIANFNLF